VLKIALSVQRFTPETDDHPRFESHEVEVAERASVLDALFALQRGPAPDLAFRFSCRVGMCGSCSMVVNGREQLTCSTLVRTVGAHLKIEPLRNLPVVRDLAVDLTPFSTPTSGPRRNSCRGRISIPIDSFASRMPAEKGRR
jgi:succinate dehydrogenase/fumarate reductase iron-sulfur protein